MKKRIGIFLGVDPNAGGMFQYAQTILDALAALPVGNYEIVVAYQNPVWQDYLPMTGFRQIRLDGKWSVWLSQFLMVANVPVSYCRMTSRWLSPFWRRMAALECDLWVFPSQDAISYQLPIATLTTIHDLMHRYERQFPEVSGRGRYYIRESRFRHIVLGATGILVDSEVGKGQVREAYGADSNRVYSLPYISPEYIRAQNPSPDFDSRYSLPNKFIFYPAQFWPHKNHIRLIDAAAELRHELPDIHLVFCGSRKNGYDEMVRHVDAVGMAGNVTVTGYVESSDVPEFYRRARAMVMPTFFGPTNIPPLEAFELGCPVAVSGIYGMPDQVGDAALLFDPLSTAEIAECLRRLWLDDALCAGLREKGFAQASRWNRPAYENRFREIIDSVMTRIERK